MNHPHGYELVLSRKRKKTIALTVKKDGRVIIHAPQRTPRAEIDQFFEKKRAWIRSKLKEAEKLREAGEQREKRFLTGEEFLYLGNCYSLQIQDVNGAGQPLTLSRGSFLLDIKKAEQGRDFFVRWYQKRAREAITERVEHWSQRLQLFPTGITITGALYRYGSCSSRNRLSFSWRIIMAPCEVIDYVVIHELAHIREKNHSRRFWGLLETILPDYRQRKLWLRENDHLLRL